MENELRLGNAFCQKGSIFVEYATFETFDLLRRKVIIIEPVPITEKWLLKFGFKLDSSYELVYFIQIPNGVFMVNREFIMMDIVFLKNLNYM